jgi:sugar O-acyltransferase (sialic acid O-acetyltransferase NeuD family)
VSPVRLVIVGAGGHGRETLDVVEAINGAGRASSPVYDVVGFVATGLLDEAGERRGVPLLGDPSVLADLDAAYVVAIGDGAVRRRLDDEIRAYARDAATLVHPLASIGGDVELAPGVVLAAGARITTNVRLGRHTQLNVGAVVSHDCRLGAYVTLSPGTHLNGNVTVGDGVFFGTGAIVTPGCTVGDGAVVGAGAVVLGDVAPGVTVVGVPARPTDDRHPPAG